MEEEENKVVVVRTHLEGNWMVSNVNVMLPITLI